VAKPLGDRAYRAAESAQVATAIGFGRSALILA
jgi:hypothetical protein